MQETIYSVPGAPRLALLTDLHNRPYRAVIDSLLQHRPSLICFAGDIVYGSCPKDDRSPLETQENALPFLRACRQIAPTFFSRGNHETVFDEKDLESIEETGAIALDNSWHTFDLDGKKIVIGGLSSARVTAYRQFKASLSPAQRASARYPRIEGVFREPRAVSRHTPDTSWLESFSAVEGYHILLSHHPEYWPRIRDQKIELVLSGHAHGGQIRLYDPFRKTWFGLFSPGQGWLPPYTAGVHDGRLVISRGLANTIRIPRLFNPIEVVYIEPGQEK